MSCTATGCFGDDGAIVGGVALLGGKPVTVIGIEKGDDTLDKVARNFGCAHPEGYRKALRQMKLAEKFGRPVICTGGHVRRVLRHRRGRARRRDTPSRRASPT